MKVNYIYFIFLIMTIKSAEIELGVPKIAIVIAVAKNWVIGDNNQIPWHLPEDLKRFRKLTIGKPCIMGRKTWDSLPKKPLPGRTNIVITRQEDFKPEQNCLVAHSLTEALEIAKKENKEIIIMGGAAIYNESINLDLVDKLYLTLINQDIIGDTSIDPIDDTNWEVIEQTGPHNHNNLEYFYITKIRKC